MALFFTVSIAAIVVSIIFNAVMLRATWRSLSLPGCGATSGCGEVTRSRWSRWGKTPVLAMGLVAYLLMLASLIGTTLVNDSSSRLMIWTVTDALAWTILGAAAWFSALQRWAVRRWCAYCLTIHIAGVISAVAAICIERLMHLPLLPMAHAIALVLLLTLIVGQLFLNTSTYAVTFPTAADMQGQSAAVSVKHEFATPSPAVRGEPTNREVFLNAGRIKLRVDDWPILGSPDARHVIAWLFDHSCIECHRQHQQLREVLARFEGKLAILAIPVPMHPACNPHATCKDQSRAKGCLYARLCWSVWQVDPTRYDEFDRRIAAAEDIQAFELVLQNAKETFKFDESIIFNPDQSMIARIATGIEVYFQCGTDVVPALLLTRGILKGRASSSAELFEIIRNHL